MLRATDLNLAIAQLVIFTPDVSAFSASKALAVILGKYSHKYDGNVQALPLPEEIPPEVPRVILQSEIGTYRLDVSPSRVTSYWMGDGETLVESVDILSNSIEVLKHYVESTEAQVGRLALVLTRVCKAENPAKLIVERFCKPEVQTTIFNELENFEIHNQKRLEIQGFSVNSWVRCKTGTLRINNVPSTGVLVEQDLNTLVEGLEHRRFNSEEIKSYFQVASAESEANLKMYFPEEV